MSPKKADFDSSRMTSFGHWLRTRMDVLGDVYWADMARRGGMNESTLKTLAVRQFKQAPRADTLNQLAKATDSGVERVMQEIMKVMRPDAASGAPVGYGVDDLLDGLPEEDIVQLRNQARHLRRARGLDA